MIIRVPNETVCRWLFPASLLAGINGIGLDVEICWDEEKGAAYIVPDCVRNSEGEVFSHYSATEREKHRVDIELSRQAIKDSP